MNFNLPQLKLIARTPFHHSISNCCLLRLDKSVLAFIFNLFNDDSKKLNYCDIIFYICVVISSDAILNSKCLLRFWVETWSPLPMDIQCINKLSVSLSMMLWETCFIEKMYFTQILSVREILKFLRRIYRSLSISFTRYFLLWLICNAMRYMVLFFLQIVIFLASV